jgi:mRNA-degrading endonuclease toxin of MazEF toxin-antitoxin module
MKKDFDKWNINKKQIHSNNENKFYGQREIWWCSLGTNIGFEQDGTGVCGERPVLILKGFSKHVCIVVPLTSSNKKNPYHFYLGKVSGRDAWLITSQIRLIDTKRLINKIGSIENIIFEEIRKTIKDLI